jgi:hypothetical protein
MKRQFVVTSEFIDTLWSRTWAEWAESPSTDPEDFYATYYRSLAVMKRWQSDQFQREGYPA